MLYDSIKRIKVFLASAGDVEKERNLLESILKKENDLHYKPQGTLHILCKISYCAVDTISKKDI